MPAGLHGTDVTGTRIPRHARYRGKRVRILAYSAKGDTPYLGEERFQILESDDTTRWVPRSDLTFTKG